MSMQKLTEFQGEAVEFVETVHVIDGVECVIFRYVVTDEKDLGIVTVKPGCNTPLQKVVAGDKTIEGLVSGCGKLVVTDRTGNETVYELNEVDNKPVVVKVGECMQWFADTELVFYEICYPPYQDGRYANLG